LVAVLVSAGHDVVMAPIKATVLPYIAKQVPVPNQPSTVRLVEPDSVPGKFVYHFFMAALPEELEKITPALIGLYFVLRSRARGRATPLEEQFGVREPLDGIMLGIAGAAGFHFVEAVMYSQEPLAKFAYLQENAVQLFNQLVQKHGNSAPAILMQRGLDAGLAAAFQVIFRGLSSAVSHLGYSGIFGYYVGLAALRPEHKWRLLLRGFLTAAIVHATWNATNDVGGGIIVPPLAFALLITSIIKARSMSPGRDANFATTLGR
jgi:RsiW-degrading membrane proteinase PrsW (M82 family)